MYKPLNCVSHSAENGVAFESVYVTLESRMHAGEGTAISMWLLLLHSVNKDPFLLRFRIEQHQSLALLVSTIDIALQIDELILLVGQVPWK